VVCTSRAVTLGDPALPLAPIAVERNVETGTGRGGTWLDLSPAPEARPRFTRRLFLAERGGDLRGEDCIEPAGEPLRFAVRFQIHPGARVELDAGGAVLELASGASWRFQCRGSTPALADGAHKGRDLVIDGIAGERVTLRWAFKREARA
jgi:hypothetical protein